MEDDTEYDSNPGHLSYPSSPQLFQPYAGGDIEFFPIQPVAKSLVLMSHKT